VAAEERLALPPLLDAWAADERGVQRGRVRRLARLLDQGVPLAEAVEQVPGALRDEDVLAIRFGAQSGSLASAVRDSLDGEHAPAAENVSMFRKNVIYLCVFAAVGAFIITFLQIKIVPAFYAIYQDFDLEPPQALRWSSEFARTFENTWYLWALAILGVMWLAFSVRSGRRVRRAIVGRFSRAARELRSADVLQKLGLAAKAGRPIAGSLSTLARYHYDPAMRNKLLFIRNEVEQGADLWQSMTGAGLLGRNEGELLRTADRVGNRPWVLGQLAAGKKRRTTRRLERLSELFLPAMLLLLGAFVLFQALSIFTPMVDLINNLSG
jgi:type II secretory pathway component PulF